MSPAFARSVEYSGLGAAYVLLLFLNEEVRMDAWELRSHLELERIIRLSLSEIAKLFAHWHGSSPVIYWQNFWNGGFKTEKQIWTTASWWFF